MRQLRALEKDVAMESNRAVSYRFQPDEAFNALRVTVIYESGTETQCTIKTQAGLGVLRKEFGLDPTPFAVPLDALARFDDKLTDQVRKAADESSVSVDGLSKTLDAHPEEIRPVLEALGLPHGRAVKHGEPPHPDPHYRK